MIKQPTQPLRFFSSYLEIVRDWESRDKGNPGIHVITEDILFIPPFQIKFDDRHEDITDFQNNIIELIDYESGTIKDISQMIYTMGVHTYRDYQNFVVYRWPLNEMATPGDYYLKISDNIETWYSEVFKLCDISRNMLRHYTFNNWHDQAEYDALVTQDLFAIEVCKQGVSDPNIMSSQFYVTKDEPLDFYCAGDIGLGVTCTESDFLTLYFVLVDIGGNAISNIHTGIFGCNKIRLIPTVSCEAQLKGYTLNTDVGHSTWLTYLMYANQMLHDYSYEDNIGIRKTLRWSNTCSICDIIYGIQEGFVKIGDVNFYWTMDYENYLIMDDPPLISEPTIIETVAEDDSANKYLLIGNQLEWKYLQIGTNGNLAKAIHNIHLHDTVEIDYDGEAHMICENNSEISYADDHNFTTKFRFRETTCPVQSCCLEICCPDLMNAIDFVAFGALPACAGGTLNNRYLGSGAFTTRLYECNGTNWIEMTGEQYDGACIYLEDYTTGCKYWHYDADYPAPQPGSWFWFANIASVTNNTDGTATIDITTYAKAGVYVQGQYSLDNGVTWINCGNPYELNGLTDSIICACGAGMDIHFRLHIYTSDKITSAIIKCDYGYSNIIADIDITDV